MKAIAACALLALACTPATTRPPFAPVPEALHAVINAPPGVVTEAARALLIGDTVPVRFVSMPDAWLETREFAGT